MIRSRTVLDSWKSIRNDTVQAVLDFPADSLDEKPLAELMSFRETAIHILDAGLGLSGVLLDGIDNLSTPEFRPMLKKYSANLPADASAQAIADALSNAMQQSLLRLSEKGADFYAGEITRMDKARVTRLEMLQFVKEHELAHRAQLFLFLRLKDIVPPTTRRRLAAANKG